MNGQSTGIHGETLEFSRLTTQDLSLPSSRLVVSTQCVQVHAFSLEASAEVEARCVGWLSTDERDRMQRFRFEEDRRHYIVGHGFLRYVLGRYCGLDPVQLKFCTLSGGKPALVDEESRVSRLRFNLTHSHGCALLAVADSIEVGVDLEQVRETPEHLKLAERFFSPVEADAVRRTSGQERWATFFRYWTGKEAVLKAKGSGLQIPLHDCALTFEPHEMHAQARLGSPGAVEQWRVRFLPLPIGWVGAVTAEGAQWTLACGPSALSST